MLAVRTEEALCRGSGGSRKGHRGRGQLTAGLQGVRKGKEGDAVLSCSLEPHCTNRLVYIKLNPWEREAAVNRNVPGSQGAPGGLLSQHYKSFASCTATMRESSCIPRH